MFRSSLPRAKDISEFVALGGRCVVDLTQRDRGVVRRACERYGVKYVKAPVAYDLSGLDMAVTVVRAAPRPTLIHCFHGRDRTGAVVARILEC